jgi:hypothetical protein
LSWGIAADLVLHLPEQQGRRQEARPPC